MSAVSVASFFPDTMPTFRRIKFVALWVVTARTALSERLTGTVTSNVYCWNWRAQISLTRSCGLSLRRNKKKRRKTKRKQKKQHTARLSTPIVVVLCCQITFRVAEYLLRRHFTDVVFRSVFFSIYSKNVADDSDTPRRNRSLPFRGSRLQCLFSSAWLSAIVCYRLVWPAAALPNNFCRGE